MPSKLFPPEIEGTLPAFYGDSLTVPFRHNRSVSAKDAKYIIAKMKYIQSDKLLFEDVLIADYAEAEQVTFSIENYKSYFNVGMSYKIQIGYSEDGATSKYYSTAGVIKYTEEPEVYIDGLDRLENNATQESYIGYYENADSTEKAYEYKFNLYDEEDNIVETTGWCLNTKANYDDGNKSHNEFKPVYSVPDGKQYRIQYRVRTLNDIEKGTTRYRLMNLKTLPATLEAYLHATNNMEEGYIELTFKNKVPDTLARGTYQIERGDGNKWLIVHKFAFQGEDPENWSFKDFTVEQGVEYVYAVRQYKPNSNIISNQLLLTEQVNGEEVETTITADFEHMYLFDGQRQLKIKYNGKVSSFKNTILEQKQDTIGSKYAHFTRNGFTHYKEFPISGLISYLADDENLFYNIPVYIEEGRRKNTNASVFFTKCRSMADYNPETKYYNRDAIPFGSVSEEEFEENIEKYYYYTNIDKDGIGIVNCYGEMFNPNKSYLVKDRNSYKSAKPTAEEFNANPGEYYYRKKIVNLGGNSLTEPTLVNYKKERDFKLEVQEWLNNGKPKLFRSATEGNYIVRIMNVSLTPNDVVGRMLHTFNATAYEIADCTFDMLVDYKFISVDEPDLTMMRFTSKTVDEIKTMTAEGKEVYGTISNLDYVELTDFAPGDKFQITIGKDTSIFTIGITGNYIYEGHVDALTILQAAPGSTVVAGYMSKDTDLDFNEYSKIDSGFVPAKQIYGTGNNILADIIEIATLDEKGNAYRPELTTLSYALFEKKEIIEIFCKDVPSNLTYDNVLANCYWDYDLTHQAFDKDTLKMVSDPSYEDLVNSLKDYEVYNVIINNTSYYLIPSNKSLLTEEEYLDSVKFNLYNDREDVDLNTYTYMELYDLQREEIDRIEVGAGVNATLMYSYTNKYMEGE